MHSFISINTYLVVPMEYGRLDDVYLEVLYKGYSNDLVDVVIIFQILIQIIIPNHLQHFKFIKNNHEVFKCECDNFR